MIPVYCEDAGPEVDAIVEGDQRLLLDLGACVARGIAGFIRKTSPTFLSLISRELPASNMGAAIPLLKERHEACAVVAVARFERAPEDGFKLPHPYDVNQLLAQERKKLLVLRVFFVGLKRTSESQAEY